MKDPPMCDGIRFIDHEQQKRDIFFGEGQPQLPAVQDNGLILWLDWGCKSGEADSVFADDFSMGWVGRDGLAAGRWCHYQPELVNLAASAYMELDQHQTAHWFDVPSGHAIQGMIARKGNEQRLYIVTTQAPPEYGWVEGRWPVVVSIDQLTE